MVRSLEEVESLKNDPVTQVHNLFPVVGVVQVAEVSDELVLHPREGLSFDESQTPLQPPNGVPNVSVEEVEGVEKLTYKPLAQVHVLPVVPSSMHVTVVSEATDWHP